MEARMRYIIALLMVAFTYSHALAFDIVPIDTKTGEIEYSQLYDSIIVWNTSNRSIDFISTIDYSTIKSIPAYAANLDVSGSHIVSSKFYWDEWQSDIFLIDCDTEQVDYLCTTDTPVEALKYIDENTIYYTRSVSPLKDIISFPEAHWKEYPYDSVLGIIDPNTGNIVAEYPIQSMSERIISLPDDRILTTSLSRVNNYSLMMIETFVNIFNPSSQTVTEGRVLNGISRGKACAVTILNQDLVLVTTLGAHELTQSWDSIVIHDIDTWDIIDTYAIDVPGYDADFHGGIACEVTDSGIVYVANMRPTTRSDRYENVPHENKIIGWVDLATCDNGVIEYVYEGRILDMAVKDGNPDKIILLTDQDEILVFDGQ
jgi:hypothetical protein